ncbi:hypothetical protein OKW38_001992 [Paraburkholderia sp. MM5496-R1]
MWQVPAIHTLKARQTKKVDLHESPVGSVGATLDEPGGFAAGHERRGAVGRGLQPFSQFADTGPGALGKSPDVKEHLILQRRDSFRVSNFFRIPQEPA